jgi:acetylglutamate kinase
MAPLSDANPAQKPGSSRENDYPLPQTRAHPRSAPRPPQMKHAVEKAAVLHEALPYIRRFRKRTFVVKYGGHAMVDEELKENFARDVCLLRYVGIQVVVVHGGGPQISQTLDRMGITSNFSGGLRVTDDETMGVVEMVLGGAVNQDIVGLISKHGGHAVGLSGKDDSFMRAERRPHVEGKSESGDSVLVDLGRVGRVTDVNPEIVRHLIVDGYMPVIAPVACDEDGRALNVNADEAASAIATALDASKLVLMTDVEGVKDGDGNHVGSLDPAKATELIDKGVIHGGMIPKVQFAIDAVANGVGKVHIIDGRQLHALLLEIFTDQGVGTQIQPRSKP